LISFISVGGQQVLASNLLRKPLLLAQSSGPENFSIEGSRQVAQANDDDAYDPFADYSDFEQTADEEEDENFFRNGRLLAVGFMGGYRGFTGTLGKIYTSNASFGLYMCYFFDLKFALQFGYLTGDYALNIQGPSEVVTGNISLSDLSFNLKYYFNTQNVTRGLADFNPYIIFGLSQVFRTLTVTTATEFAKDSALAGNLGAGFEVPIMRNKMYLGLQGMFQYLSFPDSNKEFPQSNGTSTGIRPNGSAYTILGILGVNF
jgi:hypothetical protein